MYKLFLIPVAGIEPALREEHDFESCASANSATLACYQGDTDVDTSSSSHDFETGASRLCILTFWEVK